MTINHQDKSVRVLIVDDSSLMRRLIRSGLERSDGIRVVGEACDTVQARQMIKQLDPDVITLDVEMPGMNGLEFLEKIMSLRPMPVVMVSTLTVAGADATLTALRIGAVDAIQKPQGREQIAHFGAVLRDKVLMASKAQIVRPRTGAPPPVRPASGPVRRPRRHVDLIAIGASTGGVQAIETVIGHLPPTLPPIVITQHMPAQFTQRFSQRLNSILPLDVAEARDGEQLGRGQVRIAPGDRHLCIDSASSGYVTRLDDAGPISGHKPSVDILFNSVSSASGRGTLGVILTGMGRDGAAGMKAMRKAGAWCIGQSERSCVVYGMPKMAAQMNALDEVLDLTEIPGTICQLVGGTSLVQRPAREGAA